MSQPPTKSERFSNDEVAFYEIMAQKYAREGTRKFKRVVNLLKRTVKIRDANRGIVEHSDLDYKEAFDYLGLNKSLRLFENWKPEFLLERVHFAKKLASEYNNFYSLADWQTALRKFLEFQAANEKSLLETGYPETDFDVSPWLDCVLGHLYFVKFRHVDRNGSFYWRKRTGLERLATGTRCGYRDADFLKFLKNQKEVAARLDSHELRHKVFSFRQKVVRCLISHVRRSVPDKIGTEKALTIAQECIEAGKGDLTPDEITFLKAADKTFSSYRYGQYEPGLFLTPHKNDQFPLRPGGLVDLLGVIGHVTAELALHAKSDIRISLYPWDAKEPAVGIYFDLRAFYQDYADGRADWFEDLFSTYQKNEKDLGQYLEVYKQHARQTLEASTTQAKATEEPYRFRQVDERWDICYDGKVVHLPDNLKVGPPFVRFLLAHPSSAENPVEIPALELQQLVERDIIDTQASNMLSNLTSDELEEIGLTKEKRDDPYVLADPKTKKAVKRRIDDIEDVLPAVMETNPEKYAELNDELRRLKTLLGSLRDFFGGDQTFSGDKEKAGGRIRKAIIRTINAIKKHNGPLASHLDTCIKKGDNFSYRPQDSIDWVL